jgi:hypothetical protein
MVLAQSTLDSGQPGTLPPSSANGRSGSLRPRIASLLDPVVFGCLALFAIALPHSIKGAERAWKLALILWLAKLLLARVRPLKQPLAAPLLTYVLLSAFSTLLSPDPFMSWDRMKFVCLFLAGIVVAQNLQRLAQVRWLAVLLVLSGFTAALFTGWQYTYGIGVVVRDLPPTAPLAQAGIQPRYVITTVGGHKVHSPAQLDAVVRALPPHIMVPVDYIRYLERGPVQTTVTPDAFMQSGLGSSSMSLARGTPLRAQGTLGHYVVFAEMLMQVGCLAWALLLTSGRGHLVWKLAFGAAFAAITAALFMTETRAAVAGLVIGCLTALFVLGKGARRWLAVGALLVLMAGAAIWIQRTRGVQFVDRNDISTHFRVLMWEDGVRLVRQHPWFGVGMETVRLHFREWNIRAFIQYQVQSHFHSTYLQIAVERGIPALLAWLWFCVAYVVMLWRLIGRLSTSSNSAVGVIAGIFGAFLAFSFTSFFHYNLGEESLAMLLFFYYGLASAVDRISVAPATEAGQQSESLIV